MPLIFSYGSLQQENVQLSTFGRLLTGNRDELVGFEQAAVRIEDAAVAAALGKTHHANVVLTDDDAGRVAGMVFEISDGELAGVDEYEAAFQYTRIAAKLASGRRAWVYVHAPAGQVERIGDAYDVTS